MGGRCLRVLLDTCAWIWLASDPGKLTPAASEAIRTARENDEALVPVISCWEVAKLVEKSKLSLSIPVAEWIDRALSLEGLALHPLTPGVCIGSTGLPGEFPGDPADQIIVATARELGVPVVTADRKIREYSHVLTIW